MRTRQPDPQTILDYDIEDLRSKRKQWNQQRDARLRLEGKANHLPADNSAPPTARRSGQHTPRARQFTYKSNKTRREIQRPTQPDSATEAAERADLRRLNQESKISDDDLASKEPAAYRAWIKAMIAGMATLANQCNRAIAASQGTVHTSRTTNIFDRRKEKIKKWRKDSESLVDMRTLIRSEDSARLRLRTKGSFLYLARLLRDGIWYLVSLRRKEIPAKHLADQERF